MQFTITDAAAGELDDYRRLRDPRHRRRIEVDDPPGFFIAEGETVVRRLLASPLHTRSVVVTPRRLERIGRHVPDDVPLHVVGEGVLADVLGFDLHRGVIAAADRPSPPSLPDLLAAGPTIALFEGVNDHENLGAAYRSAAALGVDGVGLTRGCCDPWYRRSVRVSMGGVLEMPTAIVEPWPEAIGTIRQAGFQVLALTPRSGAVPIDDVALGDRIALMLGAEGPGLTEQAIDAADLAVRIPMRRGLDSLNIAHAAAIAFHVAGLRGA